MFGVFFWQIQGGYSYPGLPFYLSFGTLAGFRGVSGSFIEGLWSSRGFLRRFAEIVCFVAETPNFPSQTIRDTKPRKNYKQHLIKKTWGPQIPKGPNTSLEGVNWGVGVKPLGGTWTLRQ